MSHETHLPHTIVKNDLNAVHRTSRLCRRGVSIASALRAQPDPSTALNRAPVHEEAGRDVCEREPEVADHRTLMAILTPGLRSADELSQGGIDRRDILQVATRAIVLELPKIIGAEFGCLVHRRTVPVRIV